MTVALYIRRTIRTRAGTVVVVHELGIDRVKHASEREQLGHNVGPIKRLVLVGREVPAGLL